MERNVMVPVRMNEKEFGIMKRLAKKEHLTVSDYLRVAMYSEFLLAMDKEATFYVFKHAVGAMRKKLRDTFVDWGEFEELKTNV